MKPGFPVQVLALEAYVVPRDLAGLAGFSEGVAPDLVVHAPDDFSLLVGQLFGRAVDVVVEVQHPHGQACFAHCQVAGRALRNVYQCLRIKLAHRTSLLLAAGYGADHKAALGLLRADGPAVFVVLVVGGRKALRLLPAWAVGLLVWRGLARIELGVLLAQRSQVALYLGQWLVAFAVFVDVQAAGMARLFLQQAHAVPLELRASGLRHGAAAGQAGFSGTAAYCVVFEPDCLAASALRSARFYVRLHQAVFAVVAKALCSVVAYAFAYQAPKAVPVKAFVLVDAQPVVVHQPLAVGPDAATAAASSCAVEQVGGFVVAEGFIGQAGVALHLQALLYAACGVVAQHLPVRLRQQVAQAYGFSIEAMDSAPAASMALPAARYQVVGIVVFVAFVEQARCGQRQVLTLDGVELLRQLADAPRTVVLREGAQPSLRALCFAVDLVAPKLLQLLGKIFS